MTEKDKEIQELRRENQRLTREIEKLNSRIRSLERDNTQWEHCHRQDMEDNIRLKNQVAFLTGSDHLLEVKT